MKVAIIKSFSYENSGGNGAGTVLLDKQISDKEKQEIAFKVGLSETAFILQKDENNFDTSFFTPLCEVELCGHATIAAFYYLAKEGRIRGRNETKTVYQNTKAGKLKVEITFNEDSAEYVLMQQNTPRMYGQLKDKIKQIADSLNVSEKEICLNNHEMYPTIVSTGLKDIIIPVASRDVLNSINPDFKKINNISEENDVVGYHVFTIDEGNIYARNFAPKVGIDEECATGTSNGALASLLYINGIINNKVEIIQGESMNEKSLIIVNIKQKDNILDVYVGGKAFIKDTLIV